MFGHGKLWSRLLGGNKPARANPRGRLLFWATLASLVFGAVEFGTPLEEHLQMLRNKVREHPASGEIVIIGIDNKSLKGANSWPWHRQKHADLTRKLDRMGAERIFFDLDLSGATDPEGDRALEVALAETGKKVVLVNRFVVDPISGQRAEYFPLPQFRKHAASANINFRYDWRGHVWELPFALVMEGKPSPGLSASIANVEGEVGRNFSVDYAVDPRTIPTLSAIDVLEGRVPPSSVRGKTVVIGTTSLDLGDVYFVPGYSRMSGIYLHVLGAETLREGVPVDLGWLAPFAFAFLLVGICLRQGGPMLAIAAAFGGVLAALILPVWLENHRIMLDVVPAIFLLLIVGCSLGWTAFKQAYRLRGTVNVISGLPNLNALREERVEPGRPLVAARIRNYAEITSSLPSEEERALVQQIAGRLLVGAPDRKLYQGDEGVFAWFADATALAVVGEHVEALHALFRGPLVVGDKRLDLAVTFGIDTDGKRSHANRLGSALVAADEAADEGLKWKEYDPEKLKEASWKLSLLSQLDAAIDAEEIWIAYQPKIDLASGETIGAEALVRWTHQDRGPVSPMEFVLAAEQNGRIGKLTEYVLQKSVASAAAINARGIDFELSVNLSARLIDDPALVGMVAATLKQHGLNPERLTLEVTETAALNTSGTFASLSELRSLGVSISIDDYGTGLSTLDYLKRIPATEIKIDRSFIQALGKSRSDMLLVHSTIQLAHSLGHQVVAEGVEDWETLDKLKSLGCDVVQGYLLGKPMKLTALMRYLLEERKRKAA